MGLGIDNICGHMSHISYLYLEESAAFTLSTDSLKWTVTIFAHILKIVITAQTASTSKPNTCSKGHRHGANVDMTMTNHTTNSSVFNNIRGMVRQAMAIN